MAWQLLHVGLSVLALPGLSVGDQAAGSQQHPHPEHQLEASHPHERTGRNGPHPLDTLAYCTH